MQTKLIFALSLTFIIRFTSNSVVACCCNVVTQGPQCNTCQSDFFEMLQVSAQDSQSLQETASLVPLQRERNSKKTHCLLLQPVDQICKHKQTNKHDWHYILHPEYSYSQGSNLVPSTG